MAAAVKEYWNPTPAPPMQYIQPQKIQLPEVSMVTLANPSFAIEFGSKAKRCRLYNLASFVCCSCFPLINYVPLNHLVHYIPITLVLISAKVVGVVTKTKVLVLHSVDENDDQVIIYL